MAYANKHFYLQREAIPLYSADDPPMMNYSHLVMVLILTLMIMTLPPPWHIQ